MGQYNKSFSCRRCRERKVRCDRAVPCKTCIRHGCAEQCHPYAPPVPSHEGKIPIPRRTAAVDARTVTIANKTSLQTKRDNLQQQSYQSPSQNSQQCLPDHSETVTHRRALIGYTVEALHHYLGLSMVNVVPRVEPTMPASSFFGGSMSHEERAECLMYLASNVPCRTLCSVLVSYFFENINWTYQAIHAPSFMTKYEASWQSTVSELDPIWMSLLFVVMSLSALYIDPRVCESFGLESLDVREKAHSWFRLSRQALHIGEYESTPCLTQIQVFVEAQLYWYAIKAVEALNSALGQAIKCAQAIGLDKDHAPSLNVESEMRHRIWWELCSTDIFQAFCLDRQPSIHVHTSKVPIPLNCDDSDMSLTHISPRSLDQPTRMSVHVIRTQIFKTLSKLFAADCTVNSSYECVCQVDAEVLSIVDQNPWYMNPTVRDGPTSSSLPSVFEHLQWQHHIVHSSVCVQRIRMFRPFLQTEFRHDCWPKCIDAVESAFMVYHAIRRKTMRKIQCSQKMLVQSYQIFCAAVSIAMFLLVEQPTLPSRILNDIEVVMQDLKQLVDINDSIPMAKDGTATLAKILDCYHLLHPDDGRDVVALRDACSAHNILNIAQEVYSHMGGKAKALHYLDRGVESNTGGHNSKSYDNTTTAVRAPSHESFIGGETSIQSSAPSINDPFTPMDAYAVQDDMLHPLSWMWEYFTEDLNSIVK